MPANRSLPCNVTAPAIRMRAALRMLLPADHKEGIHSLLEPSFHRLSQAPLARVDTCIHVLPLTKAGKGWLMCWHLELTSPWRLAQRSAWRKLICPRSLSSSWVVGPHAPGEQLVLENARLASSRDLDHILSIVNNAAVNIGVHVSFQISVFTSRNRLAGSNGILIYFIFCTCQVAYGILVSQPGTEPRPWQ